VAPADPETLARKIERTAPISPIIVIPWLAQVLRQLGRLHERGLVHRDVKPATISIAPDGVATLLDAGGSVGTIAYMSKEQLLGESVDARSDIYSVGVALYEATTAGLPFEARDEPALVIEIVKAKPIAPTRRLPSMPERLERIILKAIAREPEKRFQKCEELAWALEGFVGL
jgi:serine/threonine-protein kinase